MEPRFEQNLPNVDRPDIVIEPGELPTVSPEVRTAAPVETAPRPSQMIPAVPIQDAPQAVPPPAGASPSAGPTALTGAPLVASDDDLIEKEWVDRAKQVIAETRGDPYAREQAINQLQIDYIRKRYGREIGGQPDASTM